MFVLPAVLLIWNQFHTGAGLGNHGARSSRSLVAELCILKNFFLRGWESVEQAARIRLPAIRSDRCPTWLARKSQKRYFFFPASCPVWDGPLSSEDSPLLAAICSLGRVHGLRKQNHPIHLQFFKFQRHSKLASSSLRSSNEFPVKVSVSQQLMSNYGIIEIRLFRQHKQFHGQKVSAAKHFPSQDLKILHPP